MEEEPEDLVLESLRINLKKIQQEKDSLEEKEEKIKKEIERRINGE